MSITPTAQIDAWDMVPGVVDEPRDGRTYSEVVLPFVARTDNFVLQGTKFSIGGFEVLHEATDVINGDQVLVDHKAFALNDQPFQLRINLSGFVLELSIRAGFVGAEGDDADRRLLFAITEMSPREEQALRRVIRAYLNGQIANADDVMRAMDDPTGAGRAPVKPTEIARSGTWKPRIIAGFASLLCALILTVSLISIYDRYMIIESSFASVTAPKVDILSPAMGRLALKVGHAGDMVARDDPLFVLDVAEIKADLELARARVAFLEGFQDRERAITNPRDVSALDDAQIEVIQNLSADAGSLERLEDEISLEMGRVKALELRLAALSQYSPCDCVVSWVEEDGAWLAEGDPLMTLAKAGPDHLRVEALIPLKDVKNFTPGQSAFVRMSGTDRLIPAVIENILMDGQTRPRIGFPLWLRKDHSLGSVTFLVDEDLPASLIGVPADVFVTDRLPLMETVKEMLGY